MGVNVNKVFVVQHKEFCEDDMYPSVYIIGVFTDENVANSHKVDKYDDVVEVPLNVTGYYC